MQDIQKVDLKDYMKVLRRNTLITFRGNRKFKK